jgi:hypothetical protein
MKLASTLVCWFCFCFGLLAQDLKQVVSMTYENELLANILVDLKADYGLRFSYASKRLPLDKRVTIEVKEVLLSAFLDELCASYELEYQVIGNGIALRRLSDRLVLLQGRVIDDRKNSPLPYAHVSYDHGSKGVVTNTEGAFRLWIDESDRKDTFFVSSIGYQTLKLVYEDFRHGEEVFRLKDTVITLEEMIVQPRSALQLVQNALDRKRSNLPTEPYTLKGFYRTAFKEGDAFVGCLEASLDIYDSDFFKRNSLSIKTQHVRKSNDYRKFKWDESANYLAHFLLNTDLVRNEDGALSSSRLDDWNFEYQGALYFEEDLLYKVSATLRNTEMDSSLLFTADILIRDSDYAIFQVDYEYQWDPRYAQRKVYREVAIKTTGVKVSSRYRPWNNKMYLNYQIREGFFNIYDRITDQYLEKMVISDEFFVYEVDNGETNRGKRLNRLGDIYSTPTEREPEYWKKFNRPVDSDLYLQIKRDLSFEEPLENQFLNNQ